MQAPNPTPAPTTPSFMPARDVLLYLVLALVGLSFSATGPVAIIMSAARDSGLSAASLSSWVFTAFFINGIATIVLSCWLKTPLVFFWTIPGTVLIAPVAVRYGFGAVVGTYWCCAMVLLALGLTRVMTAIERWVPMPVVMAMIAGIFINYVAAIFHATLVSPVMGGAMVVSYLWLQRRENRGAAMGVPPIIGAIAVGVLALVVAPADAAAPSRVAGWLATPQWITPVFHPQAAAELLLPLLVTVLFVQNAQGIAVIRSAGYPLSARLVTLSSAGLTAASACFGGCPAVLAGPCNAILVSAGQPGRHYIAAAIVGGISIAIGLFATAYVGLLNAFPATFIAVVAGLAMLGVLEKSFRAAFQSPHSLAPVLAFAVTVSNLKLLGIGAPFWAVVTGSLVAAWMEPRR